MLKRLSQIITVTEVKITVQIDICKHSKISLFQWVCLLNRRFAHSYHYGVFDRVNYMLSNDAAFRALRDQNHVITFHEPNESQHSIGADFLFRKK